MDNAKKPVKSVKPKPKHVKPKPKPVKPKPKPVKPKPKPKHVKPKVKPVKSKSIKHKNNTGNNSNSGITIIHDNDSSNIDQYYEKKVGIIINKIKQQNQMVDNKIRFGWNSGDN